jgi:hypothetical protein
MGSDLRIAEGNGIMDLKKKETKTYNIDFFPLLIPSIPAFHFSIIPCGLPAQAAAKNQIFQQVENNPRCRLIC